MSTNEKRSCFLHGDYDGRICTRCAFARQDAIRFESGSPTNPDRCLWSEDWEGNWDTGCDNRWGDIGGPIDNGFRFCQYCGRPIDEKVYEEER